MWGILRSGLSMRGLRLKPVPATTSSRNRFSTAWPAGDSRATPGLPAVSVIMSGISTRLAFGLAALIEIDGNSVLTPLCCRVRSCTTGT